MKRLIVAAALILPLAPAYACNTELAVLIHTLGQIKNQCKKTHRLSTEATRLFFEALLQLGEESGEEGAACLEASKKAYFKEITTKDTMKAAKAKDMEAVRIAMCESAADQLNILAVGEGKDPYVIEK